MQNCTYRKEQRLLISALGSSFFRLKKLRDILEVVAKITAGSKNISERFSVASLLSSLLKDIQRKKTSHEFSFKVMYIIR